jgi:hypothetical protein
MLMKTFYLTLLAAAFCTVAHSQSKWMFENYNYIRQPEAASFVPMLHFETANNWYGELRYNYEDVKTVSLFGGRSFNGGKNITYTITPMLGASAGQFAGVTFATNAEIEWKNIFLSAQSQYSKATKTSSSSFFFNWSELGYSIGNNVYAGVALQYTKEQEAAYTEPGLFAGISFKNVSIPFYVFSPFNNSRYFVLGLNVEYNAGKKKNK